jgi:hypothetical protein
MCVSVRLPKYFNVPLKIFITFLFDLDLDLDLQEVFRVRREFDCDKGCYCCPWESCRYYATFEDRNGTVLGYVSDL